MNLNFNDTVNSSTRDGDDKKKIAVHPHNQLPTAGSAALCRASRSRGHRTPYFHATLYVNQRLLLNSQWSTSKSMNKRFQSDRYCHMTKKERQKKEKRKTSAECPYAQRARLTRFSPKRQCCLTISSCNCRWVALTAGHECGAKMAISQVSWCVELAWLRCEIRCVAFLKKGIWNWRKCTRSHL